MRLILSFIFIFIFSNKIFSSSTNDWLLIWQDNFDGISVDETKRNILEAALDKNNELQYYSKDEVFLEKGCLVLRSSKREKGGRFYTSGLVDTKNKFSFKFGKIEIRAKLPKGQGIWPAHWMLSISGKWPPEIDIMETFGEVPSNILMTNHFKVNKEHRIEGNEKKFQINFSENFHTFSLEWSPNELKWFIDGVMHFKTSNNIPDEMFYIIINTAVGGDLPGYPDETTKFPQYHYIDSVKVYKKEISGTKILFTNAVNGQVKVTPLETRFKKGETVRLEAMPGIGYKFNNWKGDFTHAINPFSVIMDKHKNVEAVFVKDENFPKLLSFKKPVLASSEEKKNLSASNITDGDYNTRWASSYNDNQWITIDLTNKYKIFAIGIKWETAYAENFEIQASLDGINWVIIKNIENNISTLNEFYFKDIEAKYLRLNCKKRATNWGFSIFELEVYGE